MKLLFVGDYQIDKILPAPTKVGKELFVHFQKMNPETYFFSYFQKGTKYSWFQKLFGKGKIDKKNYRLGVFPLILNIIKIKPDIILAVTPAVYYLPILLLKKFLRFKFVYYFHSINKHVLNNYDVYSRYLKYRFLFIEKMSIRFADCLFALSKREMEFLNQNYRNINNIIEIVDNGINNFEVMKQSYKIGKILSIICIGALDRKEKSYDMILNALSTFNFQIHVTFCAAREKHVWNINVAENIKLKQKSLNEIELRKELSRNDLFIITSDYESFSISLLEALNTGIPFISTDRVGLTERFDDEILLQQVIPPNDVIALIQKINDFLEMSENDRRDLGLKGIEFSEKYTWDSVSISTYNKLKKIVRNQK